MSDFRIGSGPFFDRGIDEISYAAANVARHGLPDQHQLLPPEQGQQAAVDDLLAMPNLDDLLDDAVRPEIEDRELLLPHRFGQALDNALADLRVRSQEQQASDPEGSRVLARASRLLNEEAELRDLMQMYRAALYKG